MMDFNRPIIHRAANDIDAIPIGGRFISELAQEVRTFRRQGERHCNHSFFFVASAICTTKLFFTVVSKGAAVAGGVDAGLLPPIAAIELRNSDSRFAGRSTRMLGRPASATPFVADPPSSETIATTLSVTASSFPVSAVSEISLTPKTFGAGVSAAALAIDFAICSRIWASSSGRFGFLLSCLKMNQR